MSDRRNEHLEAAQREIDRLLQEGNSARARSAQLLNEVDQLREDNRSLRRALNIAGNENRTLRRLQGQQQAPGHNVAEDEELEAGARRRLEKSKEYARQGAMGAAVDALTDVVDALIAARWGKEGSTI